MSELPLAGHQQLQHVYATAFSADGYLQQGSMRVAVECWRQHKPQAFQQKDNDAAINVIVALTSSSEVSGDTASAEMGSSTANMATLNYGYSKSHKDNYGGNVTAAALAPPHMSE